MVMRVFDHEKGHSVEQGGKMVSTDQVDQKTGAKVSAGASFVMLAGNFSPEQKILIAYMEEQSELLRTQNEILGSILSSLNQ